MLLYEENKRYERVEYKKLSLVTKDNQTELPNKLYIGETNADLHLYFADEDAKFRAKGVSCLDILNSFNNSVNTSHCSFFDPAAVAVIECPHCHKNALLYTNVTLKGDPKNPFTRTFISNKYDEHINTEDNSQVNDNKNSQPKSEEGSIAKCFISSNKSYLGDARYDNLIHLINENTVNYYKCSSCGYHYDKRDVYSIYSHTKVVTDYNVRYELAKNHQGQDILNCTLTVDALSLPSPNRSGINDDTKTFFRKTVLTSTLELNLDTKECNLRESDEVVPYTFGVKKVTNSFVDRLMNLFSDDKFSCNELYITKDSLLTITSNLLPYLQSKYPNDYNLKEEYFTNIIERDIKSENNESTEYLSIDSIIKLIQQPILPIETYTLLQKTVQTIDGSDKIAEDNSFNYLLKSLAEKCKNFLLSPQLKTQKDFYKEFNITSNTFKTYIKSEEGFIIYNIFKDFPPYVLKTVLDNINRLELKLTSSGTPTIRTLYLDVRKLFNLLDFSCKGSLLFYRYFKSNGVKDEKIYKYIVDMIFESNKKLDVTKESSLYIGELNHFVLLNFTNLEDAFLIIETVYDIIERKDLTITPTETIDLTTNTKLTLAPQCPIGLDETLKLPDLTPYAKEFMHKVTLTSSARAFHDKCLPMLAHYKIDNLQITYDNKFLGRISKSCTTTINANTPAPTTFKIVPAYTTNELSQCSEGMGICTITYWKRAVNHETNVLFIVNETVGPNSDLYYEGCIEVTNDYRVKQVKGRENKTILPFLKPFVRKWAANNNLKLTTSDLDMPDEEYVSKLTSGNPYKNYIERNLLADLREGVI